MTKSRDRELSIEELQEKARVIRRHVITMTAEAGSGHPGGSLSATDMVVALYFRVMRHDPERPKWPDRDRFVLSKGHAAPVLYAALAEAGYFPTDWLPTLRKLNSPLQGHPSMKDLPGVEASTGSLGQGLSIGMGMALAGRLDRRDYRVYVMIGDGESNEGQIWEAAMAAAHYRLHNLTAILDHNGFQIDGPNEQVMNLEPLDAKWRAFGWHVSQINGHDFSQILHALDEVKEVTGRPSIIIARTVKGKGVSFMEEDPLYWHGHGPTPEQAEQALKELQ
ncbi:MAG: transketolase [Anaerolineae bacterium]